MEYAIIACVVAMLAGTISTLGAYIWGGTWRLRASEYGQTMLDQQKQIAALQASNVIIEGQRVDDVGRRNAIIAALRAEVSSLEKDVEACSDPAAVRTRLQALLGSTEAAAFAAGSLPPIAAPAAGNPPAAKP